MPELRTGKPFQREFPRAPGKSLLKLHVWIFALCNTAFLFLNIYTYPQWLWFVFPLSGWGTILMLHAFVAGVKRLFAPLDGPESGGMEGEREDAGP